MNKNDINLFLALHNETKRKFTKIEIICASVLAAFLVINLSIIVFFFANKVITQNKIDEINEYLLSEGVVNAIARDEELTALIANTEADIAYYEKLNSYLKSNIGFNANVFQMILVSKPVNVTLLSFSFNRGVISINCKTNDSNPPADYTKALMDTGLFEYVNYSGFNVSGNNEVMFPISCKLKAVSANE